MVDLTRYVDEAGETVVTVYNLTPPEPCDCCICGRATLDRFAVPYYCGPVRSGKSEGGYAPACQRCYTRWAAWDDAMEEYDSWLAVLRESPSPVAAPQAPLRDKRIAELWYGASEPGHDVAPGYAVAFARAIEQAVAAPQAVGREPSDDDAKDAARYRWLKAANSGPIGIVRYGRDHDEHIPLSEIDAAIDAAMALPDGADGERSGP